MTASTAPASWWRLPVARDGLAVGVATGLYGVSFGAVSVASGLSVAQTCALSALVFTGASQFALVGVLASGGGAPTAALTAVLLGSRNAFYGLRLAPRLQVRGARRALAAHLVIDESTAVGTTPEDDATGRVGFWVTGVAVFVLWNLMTLVGAVAGNALGDPRTYGLDAAVGAAFLALLWPRLDHAATRVVGLVAAGVAAGLVPLVPAGVPVLAAGGVALLAGLLGPSDARDEP